MTISRLGIIAGTEALRLISRVVIRDDTVRACVGAELWRPNMLVEIMVSAST